jgi:thioester reductase-like protein
MAYHLLTGATGLLGSYLLRDALEAGRRMAVLIRPCRSESARDRTESLLARWERANRRVLPRPVVIEGDLSQADLDLDAASVRWIGRHCRAVIHNAASLTFHGSDRSSEPWLTNVEGMRRMLELCRATGIRQFHHVSTAYVCGTRSGRILESELDEGQQFSNDYERSKVEAEKILRSARCLDSLTVYRPSIIVGDSRTGYTSAYHGLYLALKLAHTLVSRIPLGATAGESLIPLFGLEGTERKNFVPVDWVSAALTALVGRPEYHGQTYHLVTRRPLSIRRLARVVHVAVEKYSRLADESDRNRCDGSWFQNSFYEQMMAYRSYWGDDPKFDDANTTAALPDLPCPELDDAMLLRIAKFAIETNFGKPRPRPIRPEFDVHEHLQGFLHRGESVVRRPHGESWLGLQVDGPGGGQWKLALRDGRLVAAEGGLSPKCSAVYFLNSSTFQQLVAQEVSVRHALAAGRVIIEGTGLSARELEAVLESAVAPSGVADLSPS